MSRSLFILSLVTVSTVFGFIKVSNAQEMAAEGSKTPVMSAAAPAPAVSAPAPEVSKSRRGRGDRDGIFSRIHLADIFATLVYSLMGLAIALFGYKVYDWITPFDLRKELEIDQNTSLGIVAGSIIIGLCIIVAAAIMSP